MLSTSLKDLVLSSKELKKKAKQKREALSVIKAYLVKCSYFIKTSK